MGSSKVTGKIFLSGTLCIAVAYTTVPAKGGLTHCFYIDSGGPNHPVPLKGDLPAYRESKQPIEIAATNNVTLNHIVLTMKHAGPLKKASMEVR